MHKHHLGRYLLFFGFAIILLITPFFSLNFNSRSLIHPVDTISMDIELPNTAIVLGAGVLEDGTPHPILKERLDTAGEAYQRGIISTILLSGNNDVDHNEVDVMSNYLIDQYQVPTDSILLDGFGYRTYDSCMRSKGIYDLNEAILITSKYHLPRSIYLCQNAGMEVTGLYGSEEVSNMRWFFTIRELFASYKAYIDINLLRPEYSAERY